MGCDDCDAVRRCCGTSQKEDADYIRRNLRICADVSIRHVISLSPFPFHLSLSIPFRSKHPKKHNLFWISWRRELSRSSPPCSPFFLRSFRSIHLFCVWMFFFLKNEVRWGEEKRKKSCSSGSLFREGDDQNTQVTKKGEREDARLKSPLTFVLRGRQERKDRMSHFLPGQSSLRLWVGKLLLSVPFLDSKLPLHTESR